MKHGIHIGEEFIPYANLANYQISQGHPFSEAITFLKAYSSGEKYFKFKTSGSTGPAKSVRLNRDQLKHSAHTTALALKLKAGFQSLVCISTNHIGGKMMLIRGIEVDMNLWLIQPKSEPVLRNPKIDFVALVPLQLKTLIRSNTGRDFLSNCKVIIVGGGPIDSNLITKLKTVNTPIYHTYGMTETASHVALKKLNGPEKGSEFHVLPGIEISQDKNGRLIINGRITNHQPLLTNDLVNITSATSFRWIGRYDGAINTGGYKVIPDSIRPVISNCLEAFDIQASFSVIGLADDKWGEQVTLVLETRALQKQTEKKIFNFLKGKLENHQVPKSIRYLQQLPRTPTGKIDITQTRQELES